MSIGSQKQQWYDSNTGGTTVYNWIASIQGNLNQAGSYSGNTFTGDATTVFDGTGNCYIGGYSSTGTSGFGSFIKFNNQGNQAYAKKNNFDYITTVTDGGLTGIAATPGGALYAVGKSNDGDNYTMLYKFNASGSVIATKNINNLYPQILEPRQGTPDIIYYQNTNGGCIVYGTASNGGNPVIAVFNPDLSLSWARSLSITISGGGVISAVETDGTNIYALVHYGSSPVYLVKFDSSGNVTWQMRLISESYSTTEYRHGIALSGSYVYVTIAHDLLKFDASTGSLTTGITYGSGQYVSSVGANNGNIYVGGSTYISDRSNYFAWVGQVNADLTPVWSNFIDGQQIAGYGSGDMDDVGASSTNLQLTSWCQRRVGTGGNTHYYNDYYIFNTALTGVDTGYYTFGNVTMAYQPIANITSTTATTTTTTGNITSSTYGLTVTSNASVTWSPLTITSITDTVTEPVVYSASYLVVAGGGGGAGSTVGAGYPGAGGGGGGMLTGTTSLTQGTTYSFVVGAGASGSAGSTAGNGSNSTAFGLTAVGGGGGGINASGQSGGSGGGGYGYPLGTYTGGSGTTGQGYAGGNGYTDGVTYTNSGGGGGAGAVGVNATASTAGDGGAGASSTIIDGTPVFYAGGGGGAYTNATYPSVYAQGGTGGGGQGGRIGGAVGNGTINTGGGGGGIATVTGGNGGSGIIVIRVPLANYSGVFTGSPNVTTDGAYKVLAFGSSGTYTA